MTRSTTAKRPPRTRRTMGALALTALTALTLAACSSSPSSNPDTNETDEQSAAPAAADDDIVLVTSIRGLSNPYHVAMVEGAELFAESIGHELTVLANDGDSQKQMSQIQTLVAGGKTIVLAVEPQTSSDARAIIEAVSAADGYVVTLMNKTEDLHPWDFGDSWVSHISYDNVESGYNIAKVMFDEMGGSGKIVVLRGILDTPTDQQRYAGLQQALAEYPDIEVLDTQSAEYDRNQGFSVTQTLLNKFPGQIEGIWSSNDDMALGALQAVKAIDAEGEIFLVGVDGTPEAIEHIQAGTSGFLATVSPDAAWQGGASLSLAFLAATGGFDTAAAPESDREFNGEQFVVTKDNATEFLQPTSWEVLKDDVVDPLARNVGQITY